MTQLLADKSVGSNPSLLEMNRADLTAKRDAIMNEIALVKAQLEVAKTNRAISGNAKIRDKERAWYHSAKSVLVTKGRELYNINAELQKRNYAEKAVRVNQYEKRQQAYEHTFINVAKEFMPEWMYDLVVAEAKRRCES